MFMFSPTIYPIGGLVGVCACRCVSRSKAFKNYFLNAFLLLHMIRRHIDFCRRKSFGNLFHVWQIVVDSTSDNRCLCHASGFTY